MKTPSSANPLPRSRVSWFMHRIELPPASVFRALAVAVVLVVGAGCSRPDLTDAGARVVASPNPPGPGCVEVAHLVGEGGGTFGGELISNDALIEYALNDLRNEAARVGADYVQTDPPQLGEDDGTTTTATISGNAYRCAP